MKTIRQILEIEGFPLRLMVYFASQCAKDACNGVKNKDKIRAAFEAIDLAERYGNGEDIPKEKLTASSAASNAASSASYAASSASYASYAASAAAAASSSAASYASNAASNAASYASYAASAASAASYASYASNAASSASYAASYAAEHYRPLLLTLINERMTKLEKLMIFGNELDT